jgi:beta-glucosidase
MNRNEFLRILAVGTAGTLLLSNRLSAALSRKVLNKNAFGKDFRWGIATAAYQIEGAPAADGKGVSIWDRFVHQHSGRIHGKATGDLACDFYYRYKSDIKLASSLNFNTFRFSLSWPRILPSGTGKINDKGLDYYKRVCDTCLENGMQPWVNLYHWDLPQILEDKGGWTNRDIIDWFSEYTDVATRALGDRAKHWMVLNEPMSFTSFGYGIGIHAPGRRSISAFMAAVHHAVMCQSVGAGIVKQNISGAKVGTGLSCSPIEAKTNSQRDQHAARRLDALMNRLFIEPALGMGYPVADLPMLERLEPYIKPGDMERARFDFDFIGLQHYFRVVGKYSPFIPLIWAFQESPKSRGAETTEMNWEVYPEGIYKILKQFARYPVKEFFVTESGAAFPDVLTPDGRVHDAKRVAYFKAYTDQVLRAKRDGVPVSGYLVWTLMDNFEWAEGYSKRFGLVYTDFASQKRYIKDSGLWFREMLK